MRFQQFTASTIASAALVYQPIIFAGPFNVSNHSSNFPIDPKLFDATLRLANATSKSHGWEEVQRILGMLGFDYGGFGQWDPNTPDQPLSLDYATTFLRRSFGTYQSKGLDLIDPIPQFLERTEAPVFALRELKAMQQTGDENAAAIGKFLLSENINGHCAMRADIPGQVGQGFLAFGTKDRYSTADFHNRAEGLYPTLRIVTALYSALALRTQTKARKRARILSAREAHVLTLLGHGLSAPEIADAEGRSVATIRQQLANCRERLGARTSTHAVTLAVALDEITLSP